MAKIQQDNQRSDDDGARAEQALDWFVRLRERSSDPELRASVDSWRAADSRNDHEFRQLQAMWASDDFAAALREGVAGPTVRRRPMLAFGIAAGLLVAAVAAWQVPDLLLRLRSDYWTNTGERLEVALPDGSTMTLNTGTAVDLDFAGGRRHVALLRGEAYFDVARDPDHPFRVTGRFGEVEVKGTAFAVRLEAASDTVVLDEGSVLLRGSDGIERAAMVPGQFALIDATAAPQLSLATPGLTSWRDGRLSVSSRPLSEVVDELRRYYGGTIVVLDGDATRTMVSGSFRLDDIDAALRSLAASVGLHVSGLPGTLIFLS